MIYLVNLIILSAIIGPALTFEQPLVVNLPWHHDQAVNVSLMGKDTNGARIEEYLRYFYSHAGENPSQYMETVPLFMAFQMTYNKTYANDAEASKRLSIFRDNLLIIRALKEQETGTAMYNITQFADLTVNEFLALHTGYVKNEKNIRKPMAGIKTTDLPTSRDWREDGAVTPVKNQGACGSCWAFSVTGNLEGVWKVRKGQLVSLSEQQLVDCDKVDKGCGGGEMLDAYKEVERMGGLETEIEYPYKGKQDRTCDFQSSEVRVYINDSVSLPQDEQKMAQYLNENGPIAVAINASPLMFYTGGVAHPWRLFCSPHRLNHGVLAVGFGVDQRSNKPYWLIKNSWGSRWGEQGYFRLFRGQGVCGVDQDASSVIID